MNQAALGKRIKTAREKKNMTQENLAADLTSGVLLQASEISDKLKTLSPEKQRIALNILNTVITELQ